MRKGLDFYSATATANGQLYAEKLAATDPGLLACMHGSAWKGDCAAMLRGLGEVFPK